MLRIHLLQNWFSPSDPAMEEALYEITSMRQFARLTFSAPPPRRHDDHQFPAFAGEAPIGGRHYGSHQCLSARQGMPARSRDALDEEGQPALSFTNTDRRPVMLYRQWK